METEYCISGGSTASANMKLHIESHPSPNDTESKEATGCLSSFVFDQSTPMSEARTTILHNALVIDFLGQVYVHFTYGLFEMMFAYFIPRSIGNAGSGITLFLFIAFNTIYLAYVVSVVVRKQLGKCKGSLEWFAFYSQVLVDSGPAPGVTDHSALKCHILKVAIPLVLALATLQTRYPITGPFGTILLGIMPATLVFMLHSFIPYGSTLGLYTAVIYTAAWFVYLIHDSFKTVILRAVKKE